MSISLEKPQVTAISLERNQRSLDDFQLYLRLCCAQSGQAFVSRQYATYPFRLSRAFYLDERDSGRAYAYMMNTSPGLLADDRQKIGVHLAEKARLHLTDQAATKVHSMPVNGMPPQFTYDFNIAAAASLEFLPEPLILFANAELEQTTQITLHPTAQLCWSEIILPGRLARQEFYQFRSYFSRLQVKSPVGDLLFGDTMLLEGMANPFKDSFLFVDRPVLATLIVVLPEVSLDNLLQRIEQATGKLQSNLLTGNSRLPNCNGLIMRLMGDRVSTLKAYIHSVVNCIRQLNHQPLLPNVPK